MNAQTPTIKLDSVVNYESESIYTFNWYKHSTQRFNYNDKLQLTDVTEIVCSNNDQKKITNKTVINYNRAGQVDSIVFWNVFQEKPALEKFWLNVVEYNQQGKLKTLYNYRRIGAKWDLYQKFLYLFNNDGTVEKVIQNEYPSVITASTIHNFIYNNGKPDLEIIKNDEVSYIDFQIKYYYDVSGNLKSSYVEHGGTDFSKFEYYYNSNGEINKIHNLEMGNPNNLELKYNTHKRSELANIPFDLLRFNLNDAWDYLDISYQERGMYNLTESFVWFIKLPAILSFVNESKDYGVVSEAIHLYSNSFTFIEGYRTFAEKVVFCYSPVKKDGITVIDNINSAELKVYPNPASGKIEFSWNGDKAQLNVQFYQITGACVLNRNILNNESISLDKLPEGVYIYRLSDNRKLIIE